MLDIFRHKAIRPRPLRTWPYPSWRIDNVQSLDKKMQNFLTSWVISDWPIFRYITNFRVRPDFLPFLELKSKLDKNEPMTRYLLGLFSPILAILNYQKVGKSAENSSFHLKWLCNSILFETFKSQFCPFFQKS